MSTIEQLVSELNSNLGKIKRTSIEEMLEEHGVEFDYDKESNSIETERLDHAFHTDIKSLTITFEEDDTFLNFDEIY